MTKWPWTRRIYRFQTCPNIHLFYFQSHRKPIDNLNWIIMLLLLFHRLCENHFDSIAKKKNHRKNESINLFRLRSKPFSVNVKIKEKWKEQMRRKRKNSTPNKRPKTFFDQHKNRVIPSRCYFVHFGLLIQWENEIKIRSKFVNYSQMSISQQYKWCPRRIPFIEND